MSNRLSRSFLVLASCILVACQLSRSPATEAGSSASPPMATAPAPSTTAANKVTPASATPASATLGAPAFLDQPIVVYPELASITTAGEARLVVAPGHPSDYLAL